MSFENPVKIETKQKKKRERKKQKRKIIKEIGALLKSYAWTSLIYRCTTYIIKDKRGRPLADVILMMITVDDYIYLLLQIFLTFKQWTFPVFALSNRENKIYEQFVKKYFIAIYF